MSAQLNWYTVPFYINELDQNMVDDRLLWRKLIHVADSPWWYRAWLLLFVCYCCKSFICFFFPFVSQLHLLSPAPLFFRERFYCYVAYYFNFNEVVAMKWISRYNNNVKRMQMWLTRIFWQISLLQLSIGLSSLVNKCTLQRLKKFPCLESCIEDKLLEVCWQIQQFQAVKPYDSRISWPLTLYLLPFHPF